jgi:di/tripeptidase
LIAKIPSIVGAFSYGAWGPNPHTINEKLEVESVYDVLNKIKIFLSSIKKYKKWF